MSSTIWLAFLKYCEKCAPNLPPICPDMAARSRPLSEPCKAGRMVVIFVTVFYTLSLAFDHGNRQPRSVPESLIGMAVAFEFARFELVGRIAGQHPLTWFAVTQAF